MGIKTHDEQYIEDKIERIPESGCWIWMGSLFRSGYASGNRTNKTIRVHRWLYIRSKGEIGSLELDHLCRVRCCINPDHLEPVTTKVNTLRGHGLTSINAHKTHCHRGHIFDTWRTQYGEKRRFCSTCEKIRARKYRQQHAAIAEEGTKP